MGSLSLLVRAYAVAARQHSGQSRKDLAHTPYINHPIQIAAILDQVAGVTDVDVLVAAVLHDTVEDTNLTLAQIEKEFNPRVAQLVAECTDDKSLPQNERKRLQIETASHKSSDAKLIKLADKTTNVTDIVHVNWPVERRREYLNWAAQVASGLKGVNPALDTAFDQALNQARAIIG